MDMDRRKIVAVGLIALLLISGMVYVLTRPAPPKPPKYSPKLDLPSDYILVAEKPESMEDMLAIAAISSLATLKGLPSVLHSCWRGA